MDPIRNQCTDARVERILAAFNLLRELDNEMPAQLIATLLYVASHKNCHKQALEQDLDFTTASSSRNTDWLSKSHRITNRKGLGLINKEPDPDNGRRIQLSLTREGEALIDNIKNTLYD